MAPVAPIFLALVSLFATPAFADSLDVNDFMADHDRSVQRQYEQQRSQWQADEQAAQYRTHQDTARINQPTQYDPPSWNSTPQHFNLWQGNDPTKMQACTATKYDVSCY
jgi:hypothetical protein